MDFPSPCLLFFEDAIRENTRRVLAAVGDPARLRPHMKTHKTKEIVALQLSMGITKFKCATLAEATMTASAGARDVLLAYPLVGPNVALFLRVVRTFPETRFLAVFDSEATARPLAAQASALGLTVEALIDVDTGQHRTGVPFSLAADLYALAASLPGIRPVGIHAYDGHNHQTELSVRTTAAQACYDEVFGLKARLKARGLSADTLVLGGTPTFPLYAAWGGVEISPGTCFLHDHGYTRSFADQVFEAAALLLSRVVSVHPEQGTFTLDLGHKAVAADPAGVRGILFERPGYAVPVLHNEEHWVWKVSEGKLPEVGDEFLVQPTHICPTVNLHHSAHVLDAAGKWKGDWLIAGRNRNLEF